MLIARVFGVGAAAVEAHLLLTWGGRNLRRAHWICGPFQITARTRNIVTGKGWGKLIEFTDPDGTPLSACSRTCTEPMAARNSRKS